MSDTPRTDAISNATAYWQEDYRELARQLERELAAAQAQTDTAERLIADLNYQIAALERGEYICRKCGLRKDSEHEKGDF